MGDLGMLTGYDTDATDSEYIDGLPDGAVGASKDSGKDTFFIIFLIHTLGYSHKMLSGLQKTCNY